MDDSLHGLTASREQLLVLFHAQAQFLDQFLQFPFGTRFLPNIPLDNPIRHDQKNDSTYDQSGNNHGRAVIGLLEIQLLALKCGLRLLVHILNQHIQLAVQLPVLNTQAVRVSVDCLLPFFLHRNQLLVQGVKRVWGSRNLYGLLTSEKPGKTSLFSGYGAEISCLLGKDGQVFRQETIVLLKHLHGFV